jgi:hypothetical protein
MEDVWFKALAQYGVPSVVLGVFLFGAGRWGSRMLDAHLIGYKALTEGLIRVVDRIDVSDNSAERRQGEMQAALEASAKETRHALAQHLQNTTFWVMRAIDAKTAETYRAALEAKTRSTDPPEPGGHAS